MASTTSNYISKIKQDYPTAGVDNDSQGFRDNFKNISLALGSADSDISDLQLNSIRLNQTNDFGNNLIKQAQFQDCSVYVFDDTAIAKTGNLTVDYREGSYQKFKLESGSHTVSFSNWPGENKSGSVIISVTTSTAYDTFVNFAATNLVNLSSDSFPMKITGSNPYLFQVYNDGTDENVFVKRLNEKALEASTLDINSINVTGTYVTVGGELHIGGNTYTVDDNLNTVVTATSQIGTVALHPNQVTTTFTGIINDPTIGTTSTQFTVGSASGVIVGAKFTFYSNTLTGVYTVTGIDNNKISTQEFDSADLAPDVGGSDIVFINPRYTDAPTVATLIETEPNGVTASKGDLKGQIYASSTSLYVSYSDYEYGVDNWFKIDNTAASTELNTVLPYGSIILWYGSVANVPTGWHLCDGTTVAGPGGVGTITLPDLRDKFVIGASQDDGGVAKTNVTGSLTTSGGTKDAIVVDHTHDITDPGHAHAPPTGLNAPYLSNFFTGDGSLDSSTTTGNEERNATTGFSGSTVTNITVVSTGTSGTNQNLPPYLALCYIMKITG